MQQLIIITLIGLIGAAAVTLVFDGRQRRINRQVAMAMTTDLLQSNDLPSVRRVAVDGRERFLHRLAHYKPGLTYVFPPGLVLVAGTIAASAVFYVVTLLGASVLLSLAASFLVLAIVVRGLFAWQRRRLSNQLFQQLPDAIEMVTSAVRSGLPVNEAFRTIAHEMPEPTASQFAVLCSEIGLGKPIEEAMEGVFQRTEVAEYGFFAVTLAVQMKSGGGLVETLQTLADTVRQRVALARRARALAGEVIFSSRALSVAPFILGGLLYTINPRLVDALFFDPVGRKLLAYAVTSVVVGALVIHWMVRRNTTL